MTELKTLKDIEETLVDMEGVGLTIAKQEAIKRIKSRNTGGFSFIIGDDGKVSKYNKKKEKLNEIDWANLGEMIGFIEFFNITEEELRKG